MRPFLRLAQVLPCRLQSAPNAKRKQRPMYSASVDHFAPIARQKAHPTGVRFTGGNASQSYASRTLSVNTIAA